MQVEVPSCSDEVFFIPYEPGDSAPTPKLQTIFEVPSCSDEDFFIPYEPGDSAPAPKLQTI
jgi:hypothetical protein